MSNRRTSDEESENDTQPKGFDRASNKRQKISKDETDILADAFC